MMKKPRLITERSCILSVAQRWHEQFFQNDFHKSVWIRPDANGIYRQLIALDLGKATRGQIDDIIGADWIQMKCDVCGFYVFPLVEMGDPPDYDSKTLVSCVDCLKEAHTLIMSAITEG